MIDDYYPTPLDGSIRDNWTTVSVIPAPDGWLNYYKRCDGAEYSIVCPAFLLQELRSETITWFEDGDERVRVTTFESPFTTRVVAAEIGDGALTAVTPYVGGYVGTEHKDDDVPAFRPGLPDGQDDPNAPEAPF